MTHQIVVIAGSLRPVVVDFPGPDAAAAAVAALVSHVRCRFTATVIANGETSMLVSRTQTDSNRSRPGIA